MWTFTLSHFQFQYSLGEGRGTRYCAVPRSIITPQAVLRQYYCPYTLCSVRTDRRAPAKASMSTTPKEGRWYTLHMTVQYSMKYYTRLSNRSLALVFPPTPPSRIPNTITIVRASSAIGLVLQASVLSICRALSIRPSSSRYDCLGPLNHPPFRGQQKRLHCHPWHAVCRGRHRET